MRWGEHNICRLRGADWNDALDMASERGESVAFTCAYAGNLRELAELIRALADTGSVKTTDLLEELEVLLKDDKELYDNISEKQQVLARFTSLCRHHVSGRRKTFSLLSLAENLEHKPNGCPGTSGNRNGSRPAREKAGSTVTMTITARL